MLQLFIFCVILCLGQRVAGSHKRRPLHEGCHELDGVQGASFRRYTAGEPKNLPDLNFGPNGVNLGGILAWEFLLMHWVEVRRWQDYKVPGSVNQVRAQTHVGV